MKKLIVLFACIAMVMHAHGQQRVSDRIPTWWSGINYTITFDGAGGITAGQHPAYGAPYNQTSGRAEIALSVTVADSLLFGSNFTPWDPTVDPWARMEFFDSHGRIESGWGHKNGERPSVSSAHGGIVFENRPGKWTVFGTGSVENWSTQGLFSTEISLDHNGKARIDSASLYYLQPVNAWTANPVTSPFHYGYWHKRWSGKAREPLGGLQDHYGKSYVCALAYGDTGTDSLIIAQIDSNGLSTFINLGSLGVRLNQPQFIEVSPNGEWVITHSFSAGTGIGARDPIFVRLTDAMESDTVIIGGQLGQPHMHAGEWGSDNRFYFVDGIQVCRLEIDSNAGFHVDTLGIIPNGGLYSMEHAPGDQEVILISPWVKTAFHAIVVGESRLVLDSLVLPDTTMTTGFLPNIPTYSGALAIVENPEDSIPRDTIRWTIFEDTVKARIRESLIPWVPAVDTTEIDPWDQVVIIGEIQYPSPFAWVLPEVSEEDSITAIEEIAQEIRLYPNPVRDSQWVTIEGVKDGEIIYITDILGRRAAPVEYHGRVSMRELPPGLYLFQIRDVIIRVLKQ